MSLQAPNPASKARTLFTVPSPAAPRAIKSPNSIDRHVGERVRFRRTTLNMSQRSLAEALGLTFQQVQKYEKGANRIGASRLQQIAHVLQTPVTFFFDGAPDSLRQASPTPETVPSSQAAAFLASPEGMSLTRSFLNIKDAKLRRQIVDLVERISRNENS